MGSDDDRDSARTGDRRRVPFFQALVELKRTAWWILAGLCGLSAGWFAVTREWGGAVILALLAVACAALALVFEAIVRAGSRREGDDG